MTEAAAARPADPGPMDLVEIYYAPNDVFARRAEGGEFALPLIVLPIVLTVLYYATQGVMQPVFDAEWARMLPKMMEKVPNLTPERMQAMKEMGAKWGGIGIFIGAGLVGPFVAGFVLWIVSRVVGAAVGFSQAVMIATFSFYPMIVEQVVNAAQALALPESSITSRYSLSLGPARFLDPTASSMTLALVGHVDLFTIWTAVLVAIGLKVVARATTAQAATAGAAVWILGLLPGLLGAMRAG
jgi:hypothetical protein